MGVMESPPLWWLVALVLVLVAVGWTWRRGHGHARCRSRRVGQRTGRRLLRPRAPQDCAACRAQLTAPVLPPAVSAVAPWRAGTRRRGAPRRVATDGYACPSPACRYRGSTDAAVHALIGYGHHGTTDRIQDFVCQACGTKVSARWGTAFYQVKTPPARVGEVLSALAEGLTVDAAARVFGHGQRTIQGWLSRAGRHAGQVHQHFFRRLLLPHVQLDEIRTQLRRRTDVRWLWLAVDPCTKIVPVLHLGPRTQQSAHAVVHALVAVLAPGCVPVVTSDGLALYYYALTAHFGQWLQTGRRRYWQVAATLCYGQVIKHYRRCRLLRVTHRVLCGTWTHLQQGLQQLGLSGRLNTAFVERLNLTVRQGVAALTRRTWATAQTASGLLLHLEWWRGYYHFVRPHQGLRLALPQPRSRSGSRRPQRYQPRTPAMAIGVTTHRWSAVEFLSRPCLGAT
jgi:IS1 family transposase/transposase-like protein